MLEELEYIVKARPMNPSDGPGSGLNHKNKQWERGNADRLPGSPHLCRVLDASAARIKVKAADSAQHEPLRYHQQQCIKMCVDGENASQNVAAPISPSGLAQPRDQKSRRKRCQQHKKRIAAGFLCVTNAVRVESEQSGRDQRNLPVIKKSGK